MKKSTKILIIIGVVSFVLGTVLSVVSLVLMKKAGWEMIKEVANNNNITWEVSDWSDDYDEDSEDVYVKGPFFEVDIQGEDAYISVFGINIEVEDGQGRVYSDKNEEEAGTIVPTESSVSDVNEP